MLRSFLQECDRDAGVDSLSFSKCESLVVWGICYAAFSFSQTSLRP